MSIGLARRLGLSSSKACLEVGLVSFRLQCIPRIITEVELFGSFIALRGGGVNRDWWLEATTKKSHQFASFISPVSTSPIIQQKMSSVVPSARTSAGTLKNEKMTLRKVVKKELRNLSAEEKAKEDDSIQKHVLGAEWFQRCHRICAYISCPALREVGTCSIIEFLLETQGKVLYVPRVEDKESHMRMLRITNAEADLVANNMNILEPTPLDAQGQHREDVMEAEEPVDLILLPGLAFDRYGGRLGRGGGYYDLFLEQYLKRCKSKNWQMPRLVALAYQVQVLDDETLPMDESDVFMHGLVTSQGFVDVKRGTLDESLPA